MSYATITPGSPLPTRARQRGGKWFVPPTERERAQGLYISLRHLSSYRGMGVVRAACVGACSCTPAEIDAHTAVRASLLVQATIPDVRLDESAIRAGRVCALSLELLPRTSDPEGGHRWKLSQVSLGVWTRDEAPWAALERSSAGTAEPAA
jgi:hypothetical protein